MHVQVLFLTPVERFLLELFPLGKLPLLPILALRMLRGALPLWLLLRDELTEALPLCGCLLDAELGGAEARAHELCLSQHRPEHGELELELLVRRRPPWLHLSVSPKAQSLRAALSSEIREDRFRHDGFFSFLSTENDESQYVKLGDFR